MHPPFQDNVKRVNVISSLRSDRLIDHNLKDLVDVLIQLSLYLSLSCLLENDSASRDATDSTRIYSCPPQPINLVDPKETKQYKFKEGDNTS